VSKISKRELVKRYLELFNKYKIIFLVRTSSLTAFDSKSIKMQLRKVGAEFMVVKNTLATIALNSSKFSVTENLFFGPIAVTCSDDPVLVSRLLVKLCKDNNKLDIVGGITTEKQLDKADIIVLSQMPTQKEIRAKIILSMNITGCKIIRVLSAPRNKLARLFQSYARDNKNL